MLERYGDTREDREELAAAKALARRKQPEYRCDEVGCHLSKKVFQDESTDCPICGRPMRAV